MVWSEQKVRKFIRGLITDYGLAGGAMEFLGNDPWPPPDPSCVIQATLPAKPSSIRRVSAQSSLSLLNVLSTEVLVLIFELLDFQSLSRILRVSLRGKALVEKLLPYRDMMEHAPAVLTALGKTRLLSYHSTLLLRQTLRSDKCASYFMFGGFLFLPTCERACIKCLVRNPSLWVTDINHATRCFGLTDEQLKRISIMHSIPGKYG